jgi:FtsP/CotA-like multicopper oxidase with cupredoxin domain
MAAAQWARHHSLCAASLHLDEDSSIHWHGLLVPFPMDGVPGISFPGIKARSTFVYEFPLVQAGAYWYHSHSGEQEQDGLYGPIVIDPSGAEIGKPRGRAR